MVPKNKLSTTIPLNSEKVSPGLRASNIEDLDLVKEDIWLKEPIIVRDYPSPTNEQIRYEGAKPPPLKICYYRREDKEFTLHN